jgi:hypothetical protein
MIVRDELQDCVLKLSILGISLLIGLVEAHTKCADNLRHGLENSDFRLERALCKVPLG